MTSPEQLVSFSQANIDAFVKSGQIWSAGIQDLTARVAASAQASIEETMSAMRAMSGVKSLRDAVELQAGFAKATLEKTMTETGRMAETSLRLAEQASAPITARVTATVDMVSPRA